MVHSEVHTVCYINPQLVTSLLILIFWQPPEGTPVILALLPLHHTYGLNLYAFRSCLACATLVLMPRWDTKLALRAIPKYAYFFAMITRNQPT